MTDSFQVRAFNVTYGSVNIFQVLIFLLLQVRCFFPIKCYLSEDTHESRVKALRHFNFVLKVSVRASSNPEAGVMYSHIYISENILRSSTDPLHHPRG